MAHSFFHAIGEIFHKKDVCNKKLSDPRDPSILEMVEAEADNQSGVFTTLPSHHNAHDQEAMSTAAASAAVSLDKPNSSKESSLSRPRHQNLPHQFGSFLSSVICFFDAYLTKWQPAGSNEHHKDAPLIVLSEGKTPSSRSKQKVELENSMQRHKELPGTGGYFCLPVVINEERSLRRIAPLKRDVALDDIARRHAEAMVRNNKVFHSPPKQHIHDLDGSRSFTRLGENVARGKNLREIHKYTMLRTSDRNNIVDTRFTHMGVGTAVCKKSHEIYLCQVFGGK